MARVSVLPVGLKLGPLDYALPAGMALAPGDVVEVPLGRRRAVGIVWDAPAGSVDPARLRPVARRLDVPPVAGPLRRLADWMADYYVASPGEVARLLLPRAALAPPPAAPPRYRAVQKPLAGLRLSRQRALAEALAARAGETPADLGTWARRLGVSRARLQPLVRAGLLAPASEAPAPLPALAPPPACPPRLSPAQAEAAAELRAAVAAGGFQPFLLDGVTGSGKTLVYLEAVAAALAAGRQALVLLPEIALTEPFLRRFAERFGAPPLAWHSGLGDGARRRVWRALAAGTAQVVVGARSALFLPLPRLGLVVVDEAHDGAFKQEEGVHYHGRDVAAVRARLEGVPLVLASATPSLETLENVARGRYRRLALPDRHGAAGLPEVTLVDLRRAPPERGRWLAPPLVAAIEAALGQGEQALLFLNRRGYAPLTLCRACGARIRCPDCAAWMVEHRLARLLRCHHCGRAEPVPEACPACGAEGSLVACGPGVERVAEEVAQRWPEARTAIVTSDTVRSAAEAAALFGRVEEGELDILVGTQMLAKGHDFPHLTVVGVVDADLGLDGGDLRAGERCFAQLQQVAGRAGRAQRLGRVFVQTHQPEAPLMQALAAHDRDAFLAAERAARRAAGMPPFGRLAAVILSAEDEARLASAARLLRARAPRGEGIETFGPAPAPLAMLRGRHRMRFLVQARREVRLQDRLRAWLSDADLPAGVRVTVDVDPQSFL